LGTALGLRLNFHPSALTGGRRVEQPANFGTEGSFPDYHDRWMQRLPLGFNPFNPMSNMLAAPTPPYHTRVTMVPVQVRVPAQTTPTLNFTPAGTATSTPGLNPLGSTQVWTGLP
jgi:hypothetical protein